MKEKLTRNIGLKILSVILAAILWIVITNVDDPITEKDFRNVKVTILNDDVIESMNEAYDILENETIDFTVAARRSIKEELTTADFTVTADFTNLSDVNAVTIEIDCPTYGDSVTITDGKNQMMKIARDELASQQFRVTVVQKGVPAKDYYVGKTKQSTLITVSGPKNKIERIDKIVLEVNVTDVSGYFSTRVEPKAIDGEGNEIDSSNLKFSESLVTVEGEALPTKEIDVKVDVTGKPADGYVVSNIDYEPKMIEIAGKKKVIDSIIQQVVPANIEGASENMELEVNLQELLGDELFLVDDNPVLVINITIEKAVTKDLTIYPNDIKALNLSEELTINYLSSSVVLTVSGPKKEVGDITVNSLKPLIDLNGYLTGTHFVPVEVELTGYCTLVDNPRVYIQLIP